MIHNTTVYSGRPADTAGRLERELQTYDLLDSLSIPYLRADHPAAYTIEGCQEAEQLLHITICKNLFLCNAQKKNFYLLMLPGHKKFRTAVFSRQIGSSRLSFAPSEYMEEFLGLTPGSVSVLGLMNDKNNRVKLAIDKEILHSEYIGCHPCINTSSLKIKTSHIIQRFLPAVGHDYITVDLPE